MLKGVVCISTAQKEQDLEPTYEVAVQGFELLATVRHE